MKIRGELIDRWEREANAAASTLLNNIQDIRHTVEALSQAETAIDNQINIIKQLREDLQHKQGQIDALTATLNAAEAMNKATNIENGKLRQRLKQFTDMANSPMLERHEDEISAPVKIEPDTGSAAQDRQGLGLQGATAAKDETPASDAVN